MDLHFPSFTDRDALASLEAGICHRGRPGRGLYRGAVGILDGTMIHIKAGSDLGFGNVHDWYCKRKEKWGTNAQCTVNNGLHRFTYVSILLTAKSHYSSRFSNSSLGQKLLRQEGLPSFYVLGGDAAYAGDDTALVECAFGILGQRFGVLWRPLEGCMKR